ncbi:MAG: putative metal-binding motif-containing protein [Myxococcota bacterium]
MNRSLVWLLFIGAGCRTTGAGLDTAPLVVEEDEEDDDRFIDADMDGFSVEEDCDDGDATVFPNAEEICDGRDNDCDAEVDEAVHDGWLLMATKNNGDIFEVDTSTAERTLFTTLDAELYATSGAVEPNGSRVWMQSLDDELVTVDICDGAVAAQGARSWSTGALDFGPGGTLYAINNPTSELLAVDTDGTAETIGPLGLPLGSSGMAFDCTRQQLYAIDGEQDILFQIDVETGAAIERIPLQPDFEFVGLAYDARIDAMWASAKEELYRLDHLTGEVEYVGEIDDNDLMLHPPCP